VVICAGFGGVLVFEDGPLVDVEFGEEDVLDLRVVGGERVGVVEVGEGVKGVGRGELGEHWEEGDEEGERELGGGEEVGERGEDGRGSLVFVVLLSTVTEWERASKRAK
jgi:hypothetical protein